jgi:glyceraldehyde 3-phosphate dehydrogenase
MWKVPVNQKPEQCLGEWIDREALAETMIPLIGQLYRNNNVVTSIYGRSLINRSVIELLKAHRFARHRQADESELSVHETYPLLKAMSELKLGAASVDMGKLTVKFKESGAGRSPEQFVRDELADVIGQQNVGARKGTDVVLYGFGRIGRLLARILVEKACACVPSSFAKGRRTIWPSVPACCVATRCTARSTASSMSTKKPIP